MEIVPPVRVTQFNELEPGDLFVIVQDGTPCFALKTEKSANGDRSSMVVLGPRFPYDTNESVILDGDAVTVISYGKHYSILLSDDPDAWFLGGNLRNPVCVAVHEQNVYVCTNGGPSSTRFFQCFVEFSTGKIIEGRLPIYAAYTNDWEIAIPQHKLLSRAVLKYRKQVRSS
jgi:hypothetical protein